MKKIVFIGPECTGKSTICVELAAHFNTVWIPEYLRDYAQKKKDLEGKTVTKEDVIPIMEGQLELEAYLALGAKDYLFCDTNILESKVYSEYYFDGYCPNILLEKLEEKAYDFYFLTDIDVPYEADDVRDRPDNRQEMFDLFLNELMFQGVSFEILTGDQESRLEKAIAIIENL